jgi:sRNA-binding protein
MDDYLETLVKGAKQHDLKGQVCGEAIAKEAARA